jgi:hypothetical protein
MSTFVTSFSQLREPLHNYPTHQCINAQAKDTVAIGSRVRAGIVEGSSTAKLARGLPNDLRV